MKQSIDDFKENLRKGASIALCLLLAVGQAGADAPNVISYQGRLLDNGVPANGLYDIRFRLCGESACAVPLYTETHNGVNQVIVSTGLFSATIGSITGLPAGLFDGSERWLEVGVGATPTIMLPREKLTATAFSLQAASATTVLDGAITTGKLADGAVTTAKLHGEALLPITLNKAAGRVGIGTTNPTVPFEVQAGDSHIKFMDSGIFSLFDHYSTINNYQLRLRRAQGSFPGPSAVLSGDILGELRFNGALNASSFSDGGSTIRGLAAESFSPGNEGTHLSFWTNKTGFNSTGMLERMRITASGDVGIGATVPGAKLEVAGQVKITGGTPAAGEVLTSDAAGLATWEPSSVADGAITTGKLADDAVTSAKIANGAVTTAKLHAQALDPAGSLLLQASGGNVGIGTTDPTVPLEIKTGGTSALIKLWNANPAGVSFIDIYDNAGSAMGTLGYSNPSAIFSPDKMVFGTLTTKDVQLMTDGTARIYIKSAGNVGIGTTNPATRVHISTGVLTVDGTGAAITLDDTTQALGKVLVSDANGKGNWGSTGLVSVQTFTANNTWAKPAGIQYIRVELVGGGGGGGGGQGTSCGTSNGGGGGGGGYAEAWFDVTGVASLPVTVGTGGSSGAGGSGACPASGSSGTTGNGSSFNGVTANGGGPGGGGGASPGLGGAAGTSAAGVWNASGFTGGNGEVSTLKGGTGGGTVKTGSGSLGGSGSCSPGSAGTANGTGGGGGTSCAATGGAGGNGVGGQVVIWEYK